MREFLFVTWAGGGNVQPLIALGTRLLDRGHRVRARAPAGLATRFEADGIAYTGTADDLGDDARPGVVVVDYMLPAALCVAEQSGRPVVAFVHTLYTSQAITDHSPMHMGGDAADINALRAELGLAPVRRVPDLLDHAKLVMVATTAELDRAHEPVPANVRFVGPIVERPGDDARWAPPPEARPLVLVSLGTTPMDETPVIARILDALADAHVKVVVTAGDSVDLSSLHVPPNATVTGYVRHAAVLPHADLFVNHGGLSGIGAGMMYGVPMVCMPLGREQPDNAAHVEALGIGRVVAPETPVPELRRAILDALGAGALRARATEVAAGVARTENGDAAVHDLEML